MESLFQKFFDTNVALYAKNAACKIKDVFIDLYEMIEDYNDKIMDSSTSDYDNLIDIYDLNILKEEINNFAEKEEAGYFIISEDIYEIVNYKLKKISSTPIKTTKCKINQFDKIVDMFNNYYNVVTNIGEYLGYSICYYEPLGNNLIPPSIEEIYIKGYKLKHYEH